MLFDNPLVAMTKQRTREMGIFPAIYSGSRGSGRPKQVRRDIYADRFSR